MQRDLKKNSVNLKCLEENNMNKEMIIKLEMSLFLLWMNKKIEL